MYRNHTVQPSTACVTQVTGKVVIIRMSLLGTVYERLGSKAQLLGFEFQPHSWKPLWVGMGGYGNHPGLKALIPHEPVCLAITL